jgi:hypothetical protein
MTLLGEAKRQAPVRTSVTLPELRPTCAEGFPSQRRGYLSAIRG